MNLLLKPCPRLVVGRSPRNLSTHSKPSLAYLKPGGYQTPSGSTSTTPCLTQVQQACLDSTIRVDQAGEVAANWIYRGQMVVLGRDRQTGPVIQVRDYAHNLFDQLRGPWMKDMWNQEKKHLFVMNKLQLQHNVRPTALWEVAKVAGFGLGVITALMGTKAAMACTEAVETVIGEHYDDQLRELDNLPSSHASIPLLREIIAELRDDELQHLDTAVTHDAQKAPAHALLSTIVGAGCKVAIELCKRI